MVELWGGDGEMRAEERGNSEMWMDDLHSVSRTLLDPALYAKGTPETCSLYLVLSRALHSVNKALQKSTPCAYHIPEQGTLCIAHF